LDLFFGVSHSVHSVTRVTPLPCTALSRWYVVDHWMCCTSGRSTRWSRWTENTADL